MAKPNTSSSFLFFDLTSEESEMGQILTHENKAMLQNLLAQYAEEKVTMVYDSVDHQKFIQQEASLVSKIELLRFLINMSLEAEQRMIEKNSGMPENFGDFKTQ